MRPDQGQINAWHVWGGGPSQSAARGSDGLGYPAKGRGSQSCLVLEARLRIARDRTAAARSKLVELRLDQAPAFGGFEQDGARLLLKIERWLVKHMSGVSTSRTDFGV